MSFADSIATELALLRGDVRSFVRALIEWAGKRKRTRAFHRRHCSSPSAWRRLRRKRPVTP